MDSLFEDKYPNIDRWVNERDGWIEVRYDIDSSLSSFTRALNQGGMPWEGRSSYSSLDEAFQYLDDALAEVLRDIFGE